VGEGIGGPDGEGLIIFTGDLVDTLAVGVALTNATGDPDGVMLGEMDGVWEEYDVGASLDETDGIIV